MEIYLNMYTSFGFREALAAAEVCLFGTWFGKHLTEPDNFFDLRGASKEGL